MKSCKKKSRRRSPDQENHLPKGLLHPVPAHAAWGDVQDPHKNESNYAEMLRRHSNGRTESRLHEARVGERGRCRGSQRPPATQERDHQPLRKETDHPPSREISRAACGQAFQELRPVGQLVEVASATPRHATRDKSRDGFVCVCVCMYMYIYIYIYIHTCCYLVATVEESMFWASSVRQVTPPDE